MPHTARGTHTQSQLLELNKALETGTFIHTRQMLNGMPSAEIAHLLESSPSRERGILWKLIDQEMEGDVLQHLGGEIRASFLKKKGADELISVISDLEADDLADLLQQLPRTITRQVLHSLDTQHRQRVEAVFDFPEDSAGGIMNTDIISVRPNITLDVVLRYLRRLKQVPETTDKIWVVNRMDEFIGLLPLTKLLVADPSDTVRETMLTEVNVIPATLSTRDVALLFERHDWISAPVIDKNNKLIGRITIDDVVDVIRDDADHSLMSMAGLDEDDDIFAPVMITSRRRAVWLAVNTLTAFIAAGMMGLFTETIEKVVALAILSPIVASMGGIAGSQSLTLVIRGMALGHVGYANARALLSRELAVGIVNGLIWAIIIGTAASIWWGDQSIGIIIGMAITINLIAGAIAGASLPLILKRLEIDPALAGGVILTTITDVVGFVSFLGLATIVYT